MRNLLRKLICGFKGHGGVRHFLHNIWICKKCGAFIDMTNRAL